jgi:response regulator RpfG family c-di-GMP phosphodiesterase
MALADVYDALISKRAYKPSMPHEKAVAIIREGRGTHFDPDVVDAFLALEGTFRNIALTFADSDGEREALGSSNIADTKSGGSRIRVLLAEDDPINRAIMMSQLAASGYLVVEASDGRDALEKCRSGAFDLVLTDIEMPGLDGYGLAAEIRRLEPVLGHRLPILAITSSDFGLDEEKACRTGLDGYMLKPLDPDLLARKLRAILGGIP